MFVVEQIVSTTSEVACAIGFRHIGYLYYYNENIQNLEVETEGLQGTLRRIDEMAERARRNLQVMELDVEKWQEDAKAMQDEVAAFLENKESSNTWCVNCRCPNLKWRYRLGKESKLKTSRVTSLKEQGTNYLTGQLPLAHPAPPPEPPLTNDKDFDSRKEIFKRILEALMDPTIKMFGVHGAGGVGKTRMVKEVRSQVKRDGLFDDVAIAVVSRNLDIKKVQEELAAQLGLKLDDHGREDRLLARLQNGKKNLVILDDVWDPLDLVLEEIGIPTTTDHGNKEGCCKVLVTSQKNLFHRITPKASTKVFLIPILKEKEAWTLFMKTAEISVNSEEEMSCVEKRVCDECAGLPIAILAVANALKGKESYAWQDALTQLKSCDINQIVDIDPNLFLSLKLSYDLLELEDARSCFLLCSLFPEDAEISIDDLVRYSFGMRLLGPISTLENVRNRVLTLVNSLKESCLLLDGKDDNTVKMHDVIRDVAISIAKDVKRIKRYLVKHDLKKWPERGTYEGYSAISLMSEYFHEIPRELGCKELRTLVLRSKDSSLPDSFFNGMETNLEVLDLSGMAIESLPISLSKLVKLRMLFLPNGIRNLSLLGELKSLEILRLDGFYELAPEIRQLTYLKLLDLGNAASGRLSVIPPTVLFNLTRMEELCIPDDFAEWQDEATNVERKNASLVELNSLTCLTTLKVHIPQGKSLPNNLCFENLVRFRISIGEHFDYFEKQESSTSILKLSSVSLEDKFKVLLLKSEVLYLREVICDGGEDHLGTPEQFLQTPQPSMSRPFCNLSKLDVQNCTFKYLFNLSVARRLEQLQRLVVAHCSNMEVVVGNETQGEDEEITFPRLKIIQLRGLPNLKSFCPNNRPNSITGVSNSDHSQPLFCEKAVVPALEELTINGLDNISEIWDKQFKPIMKEGIGSFSQLRSLKVEECPILVNVVPSNMVQRLRNLNFLRIWYCDSVVHEIEDLTAVFPQLEALSLNGLHDLRETGLNKKEDSLRGINVVYPNIKYIGIGGCPNLASIFSASTARNLAHLRSLQIFNSSFYPNLKIIETPKERDGAGNEPFVFPELFHMRLAGMEKDFQSFCNSYGPEESLFNQKVVFPSLQSLYILSLGNVKGIWDRTPPADSFQKLTILYLNGCHSLLYVAPSELLLGSLQNLIELRITSCELLEEVFKNRVSDSGEGIVSKHESLYVDTNVVLPRLRDVYLDDLPRLKSFCSGSKLPSSARRHIEDCPLLETPF